MRSRSIRYQSMRQKLEMGMTIRRALREHEEKAKERPILFSAPMVRAILDGRKTQTRRIVTGNNVEHFDALGCVTEVEEHEGRTHDLGFGFYRDIERREDGPNGKTYRYTGYLAWCGEYPEEGSVEISCPYGVAGDRLWVRETFQIGHDAGDGRYSILCPSGHRDSDGKAFYRASFPEKPDEPRMLWRSPYHMPRWASRITLEITKVRVERLQDISREDAKAEGGPPSHSSIDPISREFGYADFPRSWFAQLWDSINGEGAWDKNPWVWVIEFARKDAKGAKHKTPHA